MKQELKKFPKMSLVSTVYGNDDTATSTSVTQGLSRAVPEPQGHDLADHGRHRGRRRGP